MNARLAIQTAQVKTTAQAHTEKVCPMCHTPHRVYHDAQGRAFLVYHEVRGHRCEGVGKAAQP